jgi:hypothetical protein
MVIDPNYILIAILVSMLIFIVLFIRLEIRLKKLLRGNKTESIEDSITMIENDLRSLKQFRQEASGYLEKVEKRLGRSIQGVGTVRFNPFQGTGSGGNQSFASSFLNENGDGIVLSSLYSRDRVSIFAKPLKKFSSEIELTDEEKKSVAKARENASGNGK